MKSWSFGLAAVALVVACASKDAAPPQAPAWPKSLVATSELTAPRGQRTLRGAIHFHSPYSHDACDNWWHKPDGSAKTAAEIDDVWRTCEAQMRDGICASGHDFVFITDHPAHMAGFSIEELLHFGPGDERVALGGKLIANRMACPNGRRPLVFAGTEDRFMSLGLTEHVPGTKDERQATYSSDDAPAALRAAGALAAVPHSESRALDYLVAHAPDAMEIYNLHANLDPKIRGTYLGVDPYLPIGNVLDFVNHGVEDDPEPDLTFMAFLEANANSLAKWDALLATRDLPGIAGTDVHQNTFSAINSDGERGDSYRRLLRWISNDVLVREPTPAAIREALAAGRSYVAFDAFGSPGGFDFVATTGAGAVEMGGHVKLADHPMLSARRPTPRGVPLDPAPVIRVRMLRSTATGAVEVSAAEGDLQVAPTEPGAYRVEVSIEPRHTTPFLRRVASKYAGRVYPWVYSNAIHVDP